MRDGIFNNVLEIIGNTPIIKLSKIVPDNYAEVYAKVEFYNPGGSVKDRIALSMIEDAEKKGFIKPGYTIIEATSGNTGIGIAMVCAVKGYKCIIVMPESMSLERIYILKSFGAQVVLTPAYEGMDGSIQKANQLNKEIENSFILRQFDNPANPEVHRKTTAQEILRSMGTEIDAFVAGVGTGGTITGVGETLKQYKPDIQIVAVEPATSAVLSGENPGPHKIQGIGAGFIPSVLNRSIISRIIKVSDNDSYNISNRLAKEEGLFVGISAGANVYASLIMARELGRGKKVLTVLPDTGERYFSTAQYYNV